MATNETAEAILQVIKKLFVWIVKGLLIIALLGFLVYLWFSFSGWYSNGRHKNKVQVVAKFDKLHCSDKSYPLSITVVNLSSKTIEHIGIRIKVTTKGFSSRLNSYGDFDSDKILKPNEGYRNCWVVLGSDYRTKIDGENMDAVLESFKVRFTD